MKVLRIGTPRPSRNQGRSWTLGLRKEKQKTGIKLPDTRRKRRSINGRVTTHLMKDRFWSLRKREPNPRLRKHILH
jgi:hypothetical protein